MKKMFPFVERCSRKLRLTTGEVEKCGSENLSAVTSPLICLRVNPAVS